MDWKCKKCNGRGLISCACEGFDCAINCSTGGQCSTCGGTGRSFYGMIPMYNMLDERIRSVAYRIVELQDEHKAINRANGDIHHFSIENDNVEVTLEYCHCSSCGVDYSYITFPTSYLDDDNWEQKYIDKINEGKRKREEERKILNEENAKKQKDTEIKLLEKLKKKYEE